MGEEVFVEIKETNTKFLFETPKEIRSLRGSKRRYEGIIKIVLKEIEYGGISGTLLTQDRYNGELLLTL
jgi:hypothetical protein